MKQPSRSAAVAQVVRGAFGAALALVVVGADAWNNWHYFAPINTVLAIIAVASAFCLVALPWEFGVSGLAKGMALALICIAGATVLASDLGMNISATAKAGEEHANASADAAAARATLARITEVRETSGLQALVASAETSAKAELDKAEDAFGKGDTAACSKRMACKRAVADLAALRSSLAEAKARDEAKAELAKATSKAEAVGPAKVDVIAATIAPYLGIEPTAFMKRWSLAIVILLVATAQIIALTGHASLTQLGDGIAALSAANASRSGKAGFTAAKAVEPSKGKAKAKGGRKATISREQALEILRKQARQSGGRIVASGATLAASLGVSRSTVCDPTKGWLSHWVKTGAVVIEKRGEFRVIEAKASKAA